MAVAFHLALIHPYRPCSGRATGPLLMPDISAEKLAQRIFDCGLLTSNQVEIALADAGGRGRASLDDMISLLLERS